MFKRLVNFFLDILEVIVLAIGIFLIVYLLILRPHKIKGSSMEPNFSDGEYILTQKLSYYKNNPQRGDVIVFKPPISDDEFIKRIIGLPGETVSIINGKFYIDGRKLNESYINEDTYAGGFLGEDDEYLVPADEYFVAGDNRTHSSDSRIWGPIKKKVITGKAWFVYWPPQISGTVKNPNY